MTSQSAANHAHYPVPTYVATGLVLAALVCTTGAWWLDWNTRDPGIVLLELAAFVDSVRTGAAPVRPSPAW